MRILAVALDSPGHVNPMLPLLRAFAAQGDEVVVASATGVADTVTSAGLRLHPVGSGFAGWYREFHARTRGTPGAGLPAHRIEHYFLPRLFGEIGTADMLDGVVAAAQTMASDVVVFDSCAFAGPIAAAICGLPAVCLRVGFSTAPDVAELVADALSPMWCDAGQPVDRRRAVFGDLLLDTVPPSLARGDQPVPALALRPTSAPTRPSVATSPSLVHVTFGTAPHHDLDALRCIVDALADEPVRVLATIGNDDELPWASDALPANATLERYVPHAELLPRCSVIIHHGGAGTMYASLAHGLPQIIAPTGADQFGNAATMRAAGLAVTLDAQALTPEAVRAAVGTALRDDTMRRRAEGLAGEIRAMPAPDDVAQELRRRFDPARADAVLSG